MAAQWRPLTEYLRRAGDCVTLTWSELDAIVGGLPASAVDHYPQWWHGDRANTRAWRAAGYEATEIRIGVSVTFVRSGGAAPHTKAASGSYDAAPNSAVGGRDDALGALHRLDASRCLIVIPCSATKRKGGRPGPPATAIAGLAAARRSVLAAADSHADESLVMPAWQRYNGHLYRAAGPVLADLAASHRLLILSGGYGLLEGADLIGDYDRMMQSRDWPSGLLEKLLAKRASGSGLDVVAFASLTTDYAKVLRRAPWQLPAGCTAQLVTLRGRRGASAVSRSLGDALRAFVERRVEYPPGTVVERLDG